jgi:hypothetical protein
MGKRLVFVGGGHAHLTSLKNHFQFRKPGHQATLISSSPEQKKVAKDRWHGLGNQK